MADARDGLRRELARRTGTDPRDWFLTFRARHGMQVVFRTLREVRGAGEVVTQLLTCCTAVDPILAAGLVPRYADVSADTLALDPDGIHVGPSTCAVVLQHTYGIIDEARDQRLREAARGALVVEDCAHCVGRMSRDADGHPLAGVSVHSFGVEKMLPTYFGGAVWVNPDLPDVALRDALREALSSLPELDATTARAAVSYHNQIRILMHLPRGISRRWRARLEATGEFLPAVSEEELAGHVSHAPAKADAWMAEQALSALGDLDRSLQQRADATAAYAELVSDDVALVPASARLGGQALLHFPVYLDRADLSSELLSRVSRLGLYAVPWYRPVLYPGVRDPAAYAVPSDLHVLPVTQRLTEGPVGLPTDVTRQQAESVAEALADVAGRRA